jgi:hypothetical protein
MPPQQCVTNVPTPYAHTHTHTHTHTNAHTHALLHRYAPPQQYVMSIQTPRPPPAPVAAFLSPVLWRMEGPDKFDM